MGRFSRKFGGTTMEEKKKEVMKSEDKKAENVIDLTGGFDMNMSAGMGGSLDDVKWFEEMAVLSGGEKGAPTTKGRKKEKK